MGLGLQAVGYEVLHADYGAEAVSLAVRVLEDDRRLDLAVVDLVLPDQPGRDVGTQLQGLFPNLKLLFISGHAAIHEPDEPFLSKPLSLRTLQQTVRRLLDD